MVDISALLKKALAQGVRTIAEAFGEDPDDQPSEERRQCHLALAMCFLFVAGKCDHATCDRLVQELEKMDWAAFIDITR